MGRGELSPARGQPPDKEPAAPQPRAPQPSHPFLSEERLSWAGHGEKHQGLPPASGQARPWRPPRSVSAAQGALLPTGRGVLLPASLCLPSGHSPGGSRHSPKRNRKRRGRRGWGAAARSREGGHRKAWPSGKNSATTGAREGGPVTGLQFSGRERPKTPATAIPSFCSWDTKASKGRRTCPRLQGQR